MSLKSLRPAVRFRLTDDFRGTVIFCGVMLLVMTALSLLMTAGSGSINGYVTMFTAAAAIAMLVSGITTVREHLRLMLQLGVSRRTAFAAQLLSVLAVSLLLAVVGELMVAVFRLILGARSGVTFTEPFYAIYYPWMQGEPSLDARVKSVLCALALYIVANLSGIFCSLAFYRLNKAGTIALAVGTPLFLSVGLPLMIPDSGFRALGRFLQAAVRTPWTLLASLLVLAVVAGALDWLLLRRAPVKPAA